MRSWMRTILLLACPAIPAVAQAQQPTQLPYLPASQAMVLDNGAVALAPDPGFSLTPEGGRFSLRGWLDGGYIYNPDAPNSNFNGPYNSVYRSNEGVFNQAYLIGEFLLPMDGSFGVGGRIDALWGQDYFVAQSRGLEGNPNGTRRWNSGEYGVAIPQAYGQVGTNDHNVKVGHFYSIVGYEGVQSIGNFFYSKAYSYQFAGPFTHWGLLASSQLTDNWQAQAGVHMGWDTLDAVQDNVSFIGGLKYISCDRAWWSSFAITTGEDPTNVVGTPGILKGFSLVGTPSNSNAFSNRTRYSLIFDANITDNLEYVFHHWLGFQEDGALLGNATALWYGIDQYAYLRINDCWKVGTRLEWFRDDNGTRVGLTLPSNPNRAPLPGNYYSATVGLNYSPTPNLIVRPEARWDLSSDTIVRPYNDGASQSQFMLGVDVILKF
jgi:hypothetical protein